MRSRPLKRPAYAVVEVARVRSLDLGTDPEITATLARPATVARGYLLQLEIGRPLIVAGQNGDRWRTSKVEAISESTGLAEVRTQRTVYRVRWVG